MTAIVHPGFATPWPAFGSRKRLRSPERHPLQPKPQKHPRRRGARSKRRLAPTEALRRWQDSKTDADGDVEMPTPMGLGNFAYQWHEVQAEKFRKRKLLWTVPERHEYYMESFDRHTASNGADRVEALKDALTALDEFWPRSVQQKQAHESFINACLPQIYGEELEPNLERILKMIGECKIQKDVMVCWPRRMGKTMAISLFCASYMLTQPNAEIIIYSNAKRASSMLSKRIYQMVVKLAGGAHIVKKHNDEDLEIVNWCGSKSMCHAYPSASKISHFVYWELVAFFFRRLGFYSEEHCLDYGPWMIL